VTTTRRNQSTFSRGKNNTQGSIGALDPLSNEWLESPLKKLLLEKIEKDRFPIPPLPKLIVELNEVIGGDEPDLIKAELVIQRYPEVAGRVVSIASSAAMGMRGPVTDLRQAIMRIGANGLRDVTFALMMGRMFQNKRFGAMMSKEHHRAFVLGCSSSMICQLTQLDSGYGFLCGLLVDVGRLALIGVLAEQPEHMQPHLTDPAVLCALDSLHCEIGALVISRWDLPELLSEVALHHHEPVQETGLIPLAVVVSAADAAVGVECEDEAELADQLTELPQLFWAGLEEEQIETLARHIILTRADAHRLLR